MKINIHDVKQALLDERFRSSLPPELQEDVQKFLQNPGCACNHPVYVKIATKAQKQLLEYYPTKEVVPEAEVEKQFEKLSKNEWQVINCTTSTLGEELRKLRPGRKQVEVARWQDQVTVVINHLEDLY